MKRQRRPAPLPEHHKISTTATSEPPTAILHSENMSYPCVVNGGSLVYVCLWSANIMLDLAN